jgi:hypothetical protein
MKARYKELLDRAIAAMVAAIDVYNKPDFPYRAESFAILAINAWELLLKAKWLEDNANNIRCLHIYEVVKLKDGTKGKRKKVKTTRAGNPFTHSLNYLGNKLVEKKVLDQLAWNNLRALEELRDSTVHFYPKSPKFSELLQEIGAATLKNFTAAISDWFGRSLSEFNFYLMPLSFVPLPTQAEAIVLNREEKNFLNYIQSLEPAEADPTSRYSFTVNVEVRFTRSTAKDALAVKVTNDPTALSIRLTEEQILEKYPWDYEDLTKKCKERYSDFKVDRRYHQIRKEFYSNPSLVLNRFLDPYNPKSSIKRFFNPNVMGEFDKHYVLK